MKRKSSRRNIHPTTFPAYFLAPARKSWKQKNNNKTTNFYATRDWHISATKTIHNFPLYFFLRVCVCRRRFVIICMMDLARALHTYIHYTWLLLVWFCFDKCRWSIMCDLYAATKSAIKEKQPKQLCRTRETRVAFISSAWSHVEVESDK